MSRRDVFGTLLMYAAEDDLLWMGYQAAHQASRAFGTGESHGRFQRRERGQTVGRSRRNMLTGPC